MDTTTAIAIALVAAAIGVLVGMVVRTYMASQAMKAAQADARRIEAEARTRQKELILEAKDEKLRHARAAEEDAPARRQERSAQERRQNQRDEQLAHRTDG